MTALKTIGVRSASFANLQRYIESDDKWMGTRCLNISNEREWAKEMNQTLELEGVTARTKNRGYHMILAFNPDELVPRLPNGEVDREAFDYALAYGEEFARKCYPGCQVAIGAHLETCDADCTERVALHIVASRPILEEFEYPDKPGHMAREGTLYDRSPSVTRAQIAVVRNLDSQAGFSQLHRGRNVESHQARGTARQEKAMHERGAISYKDEMRLALVACLEHSVSLEELEREMRSRGFGLDLARSKNNITVHDEHNHKVRVSTLGVTREAIEARLRENAAARVLAGFEDRKAREGAHRPVAKLTVSQVHVIEATRRPVESGRKLCEIETRRTEPSHVREEGLTRQVLIRLRDAILYVRRETLRYARVAFVLAREIEAVRSWFEPTFGRGGHYRNNGIGR